MQGGPHRTSRRIEDDAGYALHRAIDGLTSYYRHAATRRRSAGSRQSCVRIVGMRPALPPSRAAEMASIAFVTMPSWRMAIVPASSRSAEARSLCPLHQRITATMMTMTQAPSWHVAESSLVQLCASPPPVCSCVRAISWTAAKTMARNAYGK